ncbi:hypothetical protein Tco_1315322 [Tanacetum coccineum]
MTESAKRHEENSNIIKEIQASSNVAIRNQGALIETLEIKIGQMSKVLQERGIGGLPGSTEPNPRDHVKSISTTKADSSEIRHMGCSSYAISGSHHISIFFETIPFPMRQQNYYCDNWRKVQDVKILKAYDQTLPQKEIDPGSFTFPCFIHNVCFDKALVDLGASVSVMPFSTYTNLGLGILSHTRLTIEQADKTIKQPRGINENVLVRIDLDSITKLVGEDNDSFDPIYGNYIELDDLDTPLEPETNQDVDFEPTVVNEPDSVKTSFIIIDDEDVTRDDVLGMPFFMKYVSCQMIMKKFIHGDRKQDFPIQRILHKSPIQVFLSNPPYRIFYLITSVILLPSELTPLCFRFPLKNAWDKVVNPGILAACEEKSPHLLSHRGFKAFQLIFESSMMINGGDIPNLDVLFLHFYPL